MPHNDANDMVRADHLQEENFGTARTPLEVPDSAWSASHPKVGEPAVVTPYATNRMRPLRGKHGTIKEVATLHGRMVGLDVEINGQRYRAPMLNFWCGAPISVDFEPCTELAATTKGILEPWRTQGARTYYGPSWDGVEQLYLDLARAWPGACVESAGWWQWPSAAGEEGGKAWRLLHPTDDGAVAVYCHSEMLPHAWTLQVTVRDVPDGPYFNPDRATYHYHPDYWQRMFRWVEATIDALQNEDHPYAQAALAYERRARTSSRWSEVAHAAWPRVAEAVTEVCGPFAGRSALRVRWSLGFSRIPTRVGSIGSHQRPSQLLPCAVIAINPMAFNRGQDYVRWIMLHELVHAALGPQDLADAHGEVFRRVCTKMGIPTQYQD